MPYTCAISKKSTKSKFYRISSLFCIRALYSIVTFSFDLITACSQLQVLGPTGKFQQI